MFWEMPGCLGGPVGHFCPSRHGTPLAHDGMYPRLVSRNFRESGNKFQMSVRAWFILKFLNSLEELRCLSHDGQSRTTSPGGGQGRKETHIAAC